LLLDCCKATYTRQGPVAATGLSRINAFIIDEYQPGESDTMYNTNASSLIKCNQVCRYHSANGYWYRASARFRKKKK
jgi:hypothetical protein